MQPLIAHVIYRFDVGGLENGVVNLINHMSNSQYRHAVIAIDGIEASFAARVQRSDTEFIALNKPPGHGFWLYPRLWRLMRRLRPAVVHTRNLAALEAQVPAFAAGVPVRVHGEHGRDVEDIQGTSIRHQRIRRLYRPFVHHYVALSRDLQDYLTLRVGVPSEKIEQIYNGVDTSRFVPRPPLRPGIAGCPFGDEDHWLIGTVGRMQTVKDQPMLARAFVRALQVQPRLRSRLRLVIVGDGPTRQMVESILDEAGMSGFAWLPGERNDIPAVLRGLDCFALPSLAEGISNTVLEAMASGLPVVATDVGGNADLVRHGHTGLIVPAGGPEAMASALLTLCNQPSLAQTMGQAGRNDVLARFSLQSMVNAYQSLYDRLRLAGSAAVAQQ
jgi:sugar transferase (PEP-CTERM/EpsH1 system associated)